jgi:hypothetical protein
LTISCLIVAPVVLTIPQENIVNEHFCLLNKFCLSAFLFFLNFESLLANLRRVEAMLLNLYNSETITVAGHQVWITLATIANGMKSRSSS